MFDAVVISNGLYGCATWNISNSQIEKLDSWKFRHLKKILRYKWSDYCSYVDIIDRIKSYGIKILWKLQFGRGAYCTLGMCRD